MKKTLLLSALTAVSLAAGAFAHGGATGVVKERMDGMLSMGKAVKSIAPMMQGQAAYDADAVRAAARQFQAHSGATLTKLFPVGSTHEPSEARPEIWQNWSDFTALAEQLNSYATGLEMAADNGIGAMNGGAMNGMSGGGMMGGAAMTGGMMGGAAMMSAEQIGAMPANAAFAMVTQVCAACHTRFRTEKK